MGSKVIPYGRQSVSEEDIAAVVAVLRSDWLTQGPVVEQFERAIAEYCGAEYAVAVNSATSALHIACLASGLGPGDMLWTSPNTFVASANAALFCCAGIDFVDIDPHTFNMSFEKLEFKLDTAQRAGTLPKVLVPVHFAGQSCEMAKLSFLAQRYGFTIIEDASHAIGGRYLGKAVGSCEFSEMAIFSFHPVKIITSGEGGMVLTNSNELYEKLLRLRNHGITRNPDTMEGGSHGPWYYQQIELGFNYRLTDIHAALGLSQFCRLDEFVSRRHALAERYDKALENMPLTVPWQHPDTFSAFHLYVIRLQLEHLKYTQREIFSMLQQDGIGVNIHYIPIHTQPYYSRLGFREGDFPNSESYYREAITLPLFPTLGEEEQDRVITSLKRILA